MPTSDTPLEEVLRSARPRSVRYSAAYLAVLALAIFAIALLVPSPTTSSSPPPLHTDDEAKSQSASYIEGAACPSPDRMGLNPQSGELICIKQKPGPPKQANASLP